MTIAVIGAGGRLGKPLTQQLLARGNDVIAIGRDADKLVGFPHLYIADVMDGEAMRAALARADKIVSCIHARYAPAILAALPAQIDRIVLMGSTRRFTQFSDQAAEDVRVAETALAASGRRGVILHPTMIYGTTGENNVQRVASYIKRFGIIPLPRGGKTLLQPIHVNDVVNCLLAALTRDEALGPPIIIAGPDAVSYRSFVKAIAAAINRQVWVVGVPAGVLKLAAAVTGLWPGLPTIRRAEIQRLLEDKNFDTANMRARLNVTPMCLSDGLKLMFKS